MRNDNMVSKINTRTALSSRERVIKALNHKEVDRVPVDLGGTYCSGAHVSIVAKLRKALGLDSHQVPVKVIEPFQMLGEIDTDLQKILGIDVTILDGTKNAFGFDNSDWKTWRTFDGTIVQVPGKFNTEPEPSGEILQYPEGDKSAPPSGKMPKGGFYFDAIIRQEPIDDSKLDPADNLEEFKLIPDDYLEFHEQKAKELYNNTNLAITAYMPGGSFGDLFNVTAPFLKHPKGIRDIEEWYISTVARRKYVMEVFARQAEIGLENIKRIYQAVGNKIQIAGMDSTDLAAQNTLFCGPDSYRELYMPHAKKLNDWIHNNTAWKTMKHCCGACEPLIGCFIEAGYDILNPVQCSARGMDPQFLVDKYGDKIVFWGGGVDTQSTLPFGSPEEVYKQVTERVNILGQKHGFVFNTVHNIQCNTPIENVLAMFEALGRKIK